MPATSFRDTAHLGGSSEAEEDRAVRPARPLPRLKVEASIKNVRVAIVEDVDDPQALTLKVHTLHLRCNNLEYGEHWKPDGWGGGGGLVRIDQRITPATCNYTCM